MEWRILVDTNVLLDYVLEREPYWKFSRAIIKFCQQKAVSGCIAAHSITNMFYILRKNFSIEERRKILLNICRIFSVEGIDIHKLRSALENGEFSDFEDCLQVECAKNFHADYIVSRNVSDYKNSSIPCVEPEEMCNIIENKDI